MLYTLKLKILIVSYLVVADTVPSCMADEANKTHSVNSCLEELEVDETGPHTVKGDSESLRESQMLAEPSAIDPDDATEQEKTMVSAEQVEGCRNTGPPSKKCVALHYGGSFPNQSSSTCKLSAPIVSVIKGIADFKVVNITCSLAHGKRLLAVKTNNLE